MVNISEPNIITVSGGGIGEAACEFKSFQELRPAIEELNRPAKLGAQENVIENRFDRMLEAFEGGCVRVQRRTGKPLKVLKDGTPVDLMSLDGWQQKLPPQIRTIAAGFMNGQMLESEILPSAILGEQSVVRVDTRVGVVRFVYPPMDDEKFQMALKRLMVDQTRVRGASVEDCSYQVRMRFFKNTCIEVLDVEGIEGDSWKDDVPENWIIASCRAFERVESLGEEDLGN